MFRRIPVTQSEFAISHRNCKGFVTTQAYFCHRGTEAQRFEEKKKSKPEVCKKTLSYVHSVLLCFILSLCLCVSVAE